MEAANPEQLGRRFRTRWHAYDLVSQSEDFVTLRVFFGDALMPNAPDPFAVRTQGKRSWEKDMDRWRHELRTLRLVLMPMVMQTGAFE